MPRVADPRAVLRRVLPGRIAYAVWSASYRRALPVEINHFDLQDVLPSVFYLFRFGHRRGVGRFLETFAPAGAASVPARRRATTAKRIAEVLSARPDLDGFRGPAEQAVLADLLLCFCLQNAHRALGRDRQVQRVAPTHYLASWIDLPHTTSALRFVPEMLVATLADQRGRYVEPTTGHERRRTRFPLGDPDANLLLEKFSEGMRWSGLRADRAGDRFDEEESAVGLDQLLTVRLAQQLGRAPGKTRGQRNQKIPNELPIATKAAKDFAEDIRRFVRSYAGQIPRHAFVDDLEACIATGLTTILGGTAEVLLHWVETGDVLPSHKQQPAQLLADCSHGLDHGIRRYAEDSMDDFIRRFWRLPEVLMTLRLLDHSIRGPAGAGVPGPRRESPPAATCRIHRLGAVLHAKQDEADEARFLHRTMAGYCADLADALRSDHPEMADALLDQERRPNPIRRLATALTLLMGPRLTTATFFRFLDSCAGVGRPNTLLHKRRTSRGVEAVGGARRTREVRGLVFSDAVLEYLVHGQLISAGGGGRRILSLQDFLRRIRKRYGFHVDRAPDHMEVSSEILQRNRAFLERRLRDLGLLRGVNDAESMKRLRPRFKVQAGEDVPTGCGLNPEQPG